MSSRHEKVMKLLRSARREIQVFTAPFDTKLTLFVLVLILETGDDIGIGQGGGVA